MNEFFFAPGACPERLRFAQESNGRLRGETYLFICAYLPLNSGQFLRNLTLARPCKYSILDAGLLFLPRLLP